MGISTDATNTMAGPLNKRLHYRRTKNWGTSGHKNQPVRYFRHIARSDTSMEKLMIMEGRRTRGRSLKRWIDQIKTLVSHNQLEASHIGPQKPREAIT